MSFISGIWNAASSAYNASSSVWLACLHPQEEPEEEPDPAAAAEPVAQEADAPAVVRAVAQEEALGEPDDGMGPGWNPQEVEHKVEKAESPSNSRDPFQETSPLRRRRKPPDPQSPDQANS